MTSKEDLSKVWDNYYQKSKKNYILKDDNFFKLEVQAISNQISFYIKKNKKSIKILELGSGSGFFASIICSKILKKSKYRYLGVDFSKQAVDKANKRKIKNCAFVQSDFLDFFSKNDKFFDIIITQRSIMAIMNNKDQKKILTLIKKHMKQNSIGVFSEVTIQAFKNLQKLRKKLNLSPLEKIWHSHHLDESVISKIFPHSEIIDYSSTYWLITRVIYPYFEEPKHNSVIHNFASNLSQNGDYGMVKLFLVKK
jgi:ubiquinone/menaquinone biosynthesis C-methylase UbiE